MGTAPLQQKLEKEGPFIFSSSHPSVLPCSSAQWLNTRTLEADSLRSHSGLPDPEGAGRSRGGQQGTRGKEQTLRPAFPSSSQQWSQILNSSQARAGWTSPCWLGTRMNSRGAGLSAGSAELWSPLGKSLGAEVGLRQSRRIEESWRRIAPVLFVPPSSSA